jgi:hypothetical protein
VHAGGKRDSYYFANRESVPAEAETPAPGNLAQKNTHPALCLAGATPGVFTKSGKVFGISGKRGRSRTEDTEFEEAEEIARRTRRGTEDTEV